jgi:hypothetical protein
LRLPDFFVRAPDCLGNPFPLRYNSLRVILF